LQAVEGTEDEMADVADPGTALRDLQVRRPQRADARRNFDALIAAARAVFAEQGTGASLEDVARRAGVGIGTLYRNFPTRRDLFESVYIGEVEELVTAAEEVADQAPWAALDAWLRRFVGYVATKRAIAEALNHESSVFTACRETMCGAGRPLLERAQAAGQARGDIDFDDLLRLMAGITSGGFVDDDQRNRVLEIALDGLRARR
jgi:AcrR family transcriptional regulator